MPSICYWICATPRSGSTALCNALSTTGVAGRPSEYLTEQNRERALEHFEARSFQELLSRIQQQTTTPNGAFGLKTSSAPGYLDDLLNEVRRLSPGATLDEALAAAFPNLRLVFLTRRNKVRQAVSQWRAIQSDLWHLPRDGSNKAPPENVYRFEAIDTLVHDIIMREAAWQQFFDQLGIAPLTVVYEDFAAQPEQVTRQILTYLGLEPAPDWHLAELPHRPIADELSERWVQRYRSERQENWERIIW
jgi:LPS sulfotransferase NodH